jgi:hypothetical protein
MKAAGSRRSLAAKIGRNPWIASLLVVAVVLAFSFAPSVNVAMAMGQMAGADSPAAMDHDMSGMDGGMSGPCCDECEDAGNTPCQNSTLCMSACGKLPVQTAAYVKVLSPLQTDLPAFADKGIRDGRSLSPPRRPPKLA